MKEAPLLLNACQYNIVPSHVYLLSGLSWRSQRSAALQTVSTAWCSEDYDSSCTISGLHL